MPTFEVKVPIGANQIWMRRQIREAVAEATRRGKLRPNSVDSITGENSGNNLGPGTPIIHFDQWEETGHRGEADPEGGRLREHQRAVRAARRARSSRPRRSHARRRAQVHPPRGLEGAGQGLQPGRGRRLRRRRSHVRLPARQGAAVPHARRREPGSAARGARRRRSWTKRTGWRSARWDSAAQTSLIGCKIGALNRLPASFFVSVAYDCWAFRRLGVRLDPASGAIRAWLYRDGTLLVAADAVAGGGGRRLPADRP